MDSLVPVLFSYPAIILVAVIVAVAFVIMIIKKTVKAIVMLILLAILTAMVVIKVGIIDKKKLDAVRDSVHEEVEKKVKEVSD